MANWQAYRAMKQVTKELGYPQNFKADFTKHDRNTMSRKTAPYAFGWIVRQSGTHILVPSSTWSLHVARYYSGESMSYEDARFYWYDGQKLAVKTPAWIIEQLLKLTREQKEKESWQGPEALAMFASTSTKEN